MYIYIYIHVYIHIHTYISLLYKSLESDLEMKPKYLTKSDVQLNPNIFRKNEKRVTVKSTRVNA